VNQRDAQELEGVLSSVLVNHLLTGFAH